MFRFFISVIGIVALFACAQASQDNPIAQTSTVKLLIFSAPWCSECGPKIREINGGLDKLGRLRSSVSTTIYVVEGARPGSRPTDKVVTDYATKYGIPDFKFVSDPWRWTTFSIYYPDKFYAIPGAVLLDEGLHEIKVFERGNFSSDEVNALIENAIKPSHSSDSIVRFPTSECR